MKLGSLITQHDADKFCSEIAVGRVAISDLRVRGLQLERMASGRAKWRLRFLAPDRRGRVCITLGDASILSLVDARLIAEKHLRKLALGEDPRNKKSQSNGAPTFAQFIEDQYLPYIKQYKRSYKTDISILKNHLLPRFGKFHLNEITRQDLVKMHSARKDSGAAVSSANRMLIMMRFIYNLCIKWNVPGVDANPCRGIPLVEENNKRERYLTVEETANLYGAVCKSANTMLKYIVPMLILTGARKREVLDAKWEDFDFSRHSWRIPITKSGKARHVPLSDGTLALLATIPRCDDHTWVFANPATGKPYVSIFFAWDSARKSVELPDVRLHDLRHSFASLLINSGRTLYEVQRILGHSQVKTTQRYAHLSQDTLLAAANAATEAVGAVMSPSIQASLVVTDLSDR